MQITAALDIFTLWCYSEREMDLTLVLQNDLNSGLLWSGLSGRKLGLLPPNECMDLSLTLITTVPGLQVINDILASNFSQACLHFVLKSKLIYNQCTIQWFAIKGNHIMRKCSRFKLLHNCMDWINMNERENFTFLQTTRFFILLLQW